MILVTHTKYYRVLPCTSTTPRTLPQYRLLPRTTLYYYVLPNTTTYYQLLLHTTMYCSVRQCTIPRRYYYTFLVWSTRALVCEMAKISKCFQFWIRYMKQLLKSHQFENSNNAVRENTKSFSMCMITNRKKQRYLVLSKLAWRELSVKVRSIY